MRIVVLDGYTLNPGDLSWKALEELGEVTLYDRTLPEELLARAKGAEILVTNKVVIDQETMDRLPDLKYIGVSATGYDIIDLAAARRRGIPVTNVPTYGTDSVAQMVFAHLLNLTQHVAYHAETVRQGRWTESCDFSYWDYPMIELGGLTMGIVGFGRIGRRVAELALAFGMRVLAYDRYAKEPPASVEMVDLDTLFRESDAVTFHTPLSPETEGMLNAQRLAQMKRTAFVINTSRGPVVDSRALAEALKSGQIAGAGLDVLAEEPPPKDNPLLALKNCYITPHVSWATRSARSRLLNTAVDNVRAFVHGKPQNIVNGVS